MGSASGAHDGDAPDGDDDDAPTATTTTPPATDGQVSSGCARSRRRARRSRRAGCRGDDAAIDDRAHLVAGRPDLGPGQQRLVGEGDGVGEEIHRRLQVRVDRLAERHHRVMLGDPLQPAGLLVGRRARSSGASWSMSARRATRSASTSNASWASALSGWREACGWSWSWRRATSAWSSWELLWGWGAAAQFGDRLGHRHHARLGVAPRSALALLGAVGRPRPVATLAPGPRARRPGTVEAGRLASANPLRRVGEMWR